jgi:hypothetical protein
MARPCGRRHAGYRPSRDETAATKSRAGRRGIGLPDPLVVLLREHAAAQWDQLMGTEDRRYRRRRKGLATWRLIRYADDFVVMVNGTADPAHALREEIAQVLAPLGLRLSESKTRVAHLSEGVDFLGFHLQWRRKRGTRDRGTSTPSSPSGPSAS